MNMDSSNSNCQDSLIQKSDKLGSDLLEELIRNETTERKSDVDELRKRLENLEKNNKNGPNEYNKLSKELTILHTEYLLVSDEMNRSFQTPEENMDEKNNCILNLKSETVMLKEEIRKLQNLLGQKEQELNIEKEARKKLEEKMDMVSTIKNQFGKLVKNMEVFGQKKDMNDSNEKGEDNNAKS